MSHCKDCGARIDFIRTEAGAWMPIEPGEIDPADCEPDDKVINELGECCKAQNADPFSAYYLSHFSVCPKHEHEESEF
jgi:hypothetical protein